MRLARRRRRRRIKPWPPGIRRGTKVEVRPYNRDELFYEATVVGRSTRRLPYTFWVVYEDDGAFEDGLLLSSISRQVTRRIVYSDSLLIVEDGTIVLPSIEADEEDNGQSSHKRRVRLLHFQNSRGVYQSGLLLTAGEGDEPDFTRLPFEVNQAMLLGVYLTSSSSSRGPQRVCVLGLGGGAIPSCLAHSDEFASVHCVENSSEVVECCREHFFLPTSSSGVTVHVGDAVEFLVECNEANPHQLDCVIVDVANAKNECPSAEVVDFFRTRRRREADSSTVYVVNALLEQYDECIDAARQFQQGEGGVACFRVGHTNRVLFLLPAGQAELDGAEMAALIRTKLPGLSRTMRGIARQVLMTKPTLEDEDEEEDCWVANCLLQQQGQ